MSEQGKYAQPFLQPLPQHDDVQTAYLLWKMASLLTVTSAGCWEWQGPRIWKGYGRVGAYQKDWLAHRLVYELCVGPIPEQHDVCHTCDNPPCCNPNHLFAGTRSDNLKDMVKKGRHNQPCRPGQPRPAPKLSDAAVRDIRRRGASGEKGVYQQLAREYNISAALVWGIVKRRRRKSVPDTPGD